MHKLQYVFPLVKYVLIIVLDTARVAPTQNRVLTAMKVL